MKLYGAPRRAMLTCRWGCCGSAVALRCRRGSQAEQSIRKTFRKKARRQDKALCDE